MTAKSFMSDLLTHGEGIDDGRVVEPRFPPLYILVDGECNVRWMTKEEGDEYRNDSDLFLRKAVLWMEHSMNKKKVN